MEKVCCFREYWSECIDRKLQRMSWNIPIALNCVNNYKISCDMRSIIYTCTCKMWSSMPIAYRWDTLLNVVYMVHFHMLMFRNMQCIYGLMLTSHVQMKMWEFNPHVWQILFYIYYSLLAFYIWWCESLDLYKKNCSKKSKWTLSRNEWIEPNLLVG